MVLRAGIILPFQFGDAKKLLMIGSPEEDRELQLFDFTNVVRAAFNVYNFEFRNKKIDFQIPDGLLINYLDQSSDLSNFVIQIEEAAHVLSSETETETLSVEPSCSQRKPNAMPNTYIQKPVESETNPLMRNNFTIGTTTLPRGSGDLSSPLDVTSHSDHSISNNVESTHKMRRAQFYASRTPESLTQSLDPNDIVPKSEHDDIEMNANKIRQRQQQHLQISQHQHQHSSHFFPNYGHTILANSAALAPVPTQSQHQQSLPHVTNRFRRRGERMSKDQKEMYVKFFEENPCMLQQRRNDALLSPLWNKLANMLNSVQQGAVKNVEEWKQTFDAWRYRVFMYTRYNSKLIGEAAQNPKNYKPLTHTDQRAYAMWTSHRNSSSTEYDKMDMFAGLEEPQNDDYDY